MRGRKKGEKDKERERDLRVDEEKVRKAAINKKFLHQWQGY